ncbi:DGQHR domain-containing protein [uncultured Methanobrevibacter sp.]|uniref:DGQHR domain-containing protein n=1 Tax=uncultured Methanobrevibacter sp. TaxID=253161 RepID=UPI0025E1467E|nr:DGQHR domain-containing protein [uncultured Methanobrevibacter sp.]
MPNSENNNQNSLNNKANVGKAKINKKFKNKIKKLFTLSGFDYIETENHHFKIGLRVVEIDSLYIDKNILIVCEDTSTSNDIKSHIRKKHEAFDQIEKNKRIFLDWIKKEFSYNKIEQYNENQYIIKYLYFSQNELNLTKEDEQLYPLIRFVEPRYLEYFNRMAQCIHKSVKYEVYRFLNITSNQIGINTTESTQKCISATIISPKESTGINNGVRIVSFMMSAETLIKNSYVLRKDNWEDSITLYQRLIQKEKIKGIRKFLATRQEAFYNNIIVALPSNVYFLDKEDHPIDIDSIGGYGVCKMMLPDEMNSICIIDGQHRVYAHYEGETNDPYESDIANLRKKLHLLVTGLVFPNEMSDIQKSKIESSIFLDINTNAKPVPPDVLLHIKGLKDPLSDIGLARAVIEKLNKGKVFPHMFELSALDNGKIKIASIIKFALRYLVTIEPKDKKSLFDFWDGDKNNLKRLDDSEYRSYIDFCVKHITIYFSALKDSHQQEWNNPNSKLLSVISLNGFIIAYNRYIDQKNELGNFDLFNNRFRQLHTDFSRESFPYTSSQYKKFSDEILKDALLNSKR